MFKKGMKVKVVNPVYKNYEVGTILTLTKKNGPSYSKYFGDRAYWWSVGTNGIGVFEGEIEPLEENNWKKRIEEMKVRL